MKLRLTLIAVVWLLAVFWVLSHRSYLIVSTATVLLGMAAAIILYMFSAFSAWRRK